MGFETGPRRFPQNSEFSSMTSDSKDAVDASRPKGVRGVLAVGEHAIKKPEIFQLNNV